MRLKNDQLETFSTNLKQLHRLNTTTYDTFEALAEDYLQTGCQILGFSTGIVSSFQENTYRIEAVRSNIKHLEVKAEVAMQETYCGEVARLRQTIACAHIGQSDTLSRHPAYQRGLSFESYLGTPIWVDGEFYGTLCFADLNIRSQEFHSHEREIIELMAQSLGKFVAGHRIEQQRQKAKEETQLLLSVTQAISQAPDFDSALARALQQVCEASGWSYGEAWIPSVDGTVLECSPAWYANGLRGDSDAAVQRFRSYSEQLTFAPGEGIPGRAWEQGQPEYLQDLTLSVKGLGDRVKLAVACGLSVGLSVPIVVAPIPEQGLAGRVLAVLVFLHFEHSTSDARQEDERLAELVASVATQLGTVMQQKQAEAELRALFAAMDDLVLIRDRQGRCLKVAPTNATSPTKPFREKVGTTLHEVLPQQTADRLLTAIAQTLDEYQTTHVEYCMKIEEREIWLDGRFSPLSANTVLIVARDISDRIKVQSELQTLASELEYRVYERTAQLRDANQILRQEISERITAQSELAKSEARFRSAVDNIPDIFAIYDRDRRYQFVNTEGIRIFNKPVEDLLGRTDAEIFPREVSSILQPLLESAIATRKPQTGECTVSLPHFGRRTFVLTYVPLIDRKGEIYQLLSIAHDITERKQAEQALQEAKEQLQAVLDAVPGFISWITIGEDDNGEGLSLHYLGVNRKLANSLNLSPEDFVGQPIGFITPNSPFTRSIEHFFQTSASSTSETINFGSEDSPSNYLIVAQKYQHDTAAVSVGIDITARVQTELQLQRAYQRLQLLSELAFKIRRSLDIAEILQTTVSEIQTLLNADRVFIVERLSEQAGKVVKEAALPNRASVQTANLLFPCFCADYQEKFLEGKAVIFDDVISAELPAAEQPILQRFQVRAKLIVPIFTQESLWGCLIVHQCDRPRKWHNDEIELLQQLADQIGIALSQAQLLDRLEERVQERTAELQTANRQLSQEIAERTRAELALRESEEQLRRVINNNAYGVIVCTGEGFVRFINPAAELIFGRSATELLGVELGMPLPDSEANELPIYRPQGDRVVVEMRSVEINWEGETANLISMMDITERKAVERMKDEFLSIASHELRTPLTSIRGSLGLLATGRLGSLSEKGQRMLDIAVKNTERLGRLLNDILDLERMESGKVKMVQQDCNAVPLIVQAAESMQSMADEAGVMLQLEVNGSALLASASRRSAEPDSVPLWADPDQILQTLTNLISNSIKFSTPGKSIWIGVISEPNSVLFYVRDQGRGIPTDKLEKVFGRFQQVDASDSREKGGTGLGLAICREIIKQHGGRIWVESVVGEGSTFFVRLPNRQENE
nr:GAF domain-containing protein [Oscillatoria sp. FACHB-1406]